MTAERRRHFHEELDGLQDQLMEMAGRTEEVLRYSVEGYLDRSGPLGVNAKSKDRVIDALEIDIYETAVELLALQQPMARDLRLIFATLRVANDLERVGDHAVNMGQATDRLMSRGIIPETPEIREMAGLATTMLSGALAAFTARDPKAAIAVCRRDDEMDDLRRHVFTQLLPRMQEEPEHIGSFLEVLLVSQNLERIADLATNIAEDVVFMVEGRSIMHDPSALEAG